MRIAICDSDYGTTATLENLLYLNASHEGLRIETEAYTRGEYLLNDMLSGISYDLLFSERMLPDGSGLSLAKNIRSFDKKILIVFHSSFHNALEDLFHVRTFRFLGKPLDALLVRECFLAASEECKDTSDGLVFTEGHGQKKLPYHEVAFFESDRRKIVIHCRDGSLNSFYGKLNALEQSLRSTNHDFLRIHQSYLVNTSTIESLSADGIALSGNIYLPVSAAHRAEVKTHLARLTPP